MLSIEETKALLLSTNLTDHELEELRDVAYMLAQIAYEGWRSSSEPDDQTP